MGNILEIKDLQVRYGGIQAVQGVSLDIPRGSIVTLIGANGAGKSSIIRSIAGLNKHIGGDILLTRHEGEPPVSLRGLKPEDMVRKGISLSPEGRRILPHLRRKIFFWARIPVRTLRPLLKIWTGSTPCFPASKNATGRRAAPFPAANSKCWPWAVPS